MLVDISGNTLIFLLKKLYLDVLKLRSNMKQWQFKVKNICLETLKTWTEQTRQSISRKPFRKKVRYLYYSILHTSNVEISCVLHNKVPLLARGHSEQGSRNRYQIHFSRVWYMLISTSVDQFWARQFGCVQI